MGAPSGENAKARLQAHDFAPLGQGGRAFGGLGDGGDDRLEPHDIAVEVGEGLIELAHKITAQASGTIKSDSAASAWTMAGGSLGRRCWVLIGIVESPEIWETVTTRYALCQ
jgi:hypothetical protein